MAIDMPTTLYAGWVKDRPLVVSEWQGTIAAWIEAQGGVMAKYRLVRYKPKALRKATGTPVGAKAPRVKQSTAGAAIDPRPTGAPHKRSGKKGVVVE